MQVRLKSLLIAVLFAMINHAVAQTPASCSFTLFDFGGVSGPTPSGINRWGNVIGNSQEGSFIRFTDGRIQKLGLPLVAKRNAFGVTVGSFSTVDNKTHGFVAHGTSRVTFDFPGAEHTELKGINRYGTVVGNADSPAAFSVAFVIRNGKTSVLPFGNNTTASVQAISDTGVIVGNHLVPEVSHPDTLEEHGFVFANGHFVDFMFPGATSGTANDINASGTIVGSFANANGPGNYIYSGGRFFTVALPGGASGQISGINGFGEITGFIFQSTTPLTRGFVGRCTLP